MNRTIAAAAALALLAVTGGCQQKAEAPAVAAPKLSEADAGAAADKTEAEWGSMDVKRVEALYAPGVIGFDPMEPALSTDWSNWDKLQQGFVKMKFDSVKSTTRKIQVLDDNTFVASGTATLTSKDGPMKTATMRYTDVYHKQDDGSWKIVNEHVSLEPKPAKA